MVVSLPLSVLASKSTHKAKMGTIITPRRSLAILFVPVLCFSQAFGLTAPKQATRSTSTLREVLQQHAATFLAPSTVLFFMGAKDPSVASAFANKISNQYDDGPKRRGPQICVCVCAVGYTDPQLPLGLFISVLSLDFPPPSRTTQHQDFGSFHSHKSRRR